MYGCVPEFLHRSARIAALTLSLVGATPSQAGLVLDFDLAGSALSLGTLVNVADGMGASVSGTARVELTGRCSEAVFTFPIVQNVTFTNPLSITLRDLGSGMATLDASVTGMNNALSFRLSARGRQAPEPFEAGLLALGLLALCGVAALRRLQML
jgi:hypothetical protein